MQTISNGSESGAETTHGSAGFEEVVVPLMSDAYRTALRLVRHSDEAHDLTQEALLRALRGFANFTPGSNARAWLRTIVQSEFLTRYRRNQRQPDIVRRDPEDISDENPANPLWRLDPSRDDTPDRISDPRLREALDGLPAPFREAIQLVDIDELSYDEAAAALRCPVNTLRSRLFRGRRRLSAVLREAGTSARWHAGGRRSRFR
jgi:RNA polymerase sigma-70 factor (ECF subfamily)